MSEIPVRCFTCGKIIGNKWEQFRQKLLEGKTCDQALSELGLSRYCCRAMLKCHVPVRI